MSSENSNKALSFTTKNLSNSLKLEINNFSYGTYDIDIEDIILVEGESSLEAYNDYKSDKKTVTLTAPLKGIPNGVKDTIEKVGGE